MTTVSTLLHLLTQYGYVLLFAACIIEGPITSVLGGFLAFQGIFNPYIVFIIVLLGDVAGDMLFYFIGYLGTLNARFFRFIHGDGSTMAKFKEKFHAHHGKAIVIAKYTQTGMGVLTTAGAVRAPFGEFVWYNFLATVPKSLILVCIGYFFGHAYESIDAGLRIYSIAAISLVIVCVLTFFIVRTIRRRS